MSDSFNQPKSDQSTPRLSQTVNVDGREFRPVSAPSFFVTSIQMMAMPNDLAIMFGRVRAAVPATPSSEGGAIALNEPACIVQMSYQSAKDLHLLLGDALEEYEKEWGAVNTDFVKSRKR